MILMTGATGFVGRSLLRLLLSENQILRCIVRRPDRRVLLSHPNLTWIEGDLLQPQRFASAFEGVDTVIHLVGILVEDRERSYDRIHRQGTEAMVAMARTAGVRRYLQMSALGTRPQARSRYHQTKWAAEEAVRASGLAYTIFRPSVIYGREDRFINVLASLIDWSPVIPLMGQTLHRLQPIWVEDVARYFQQSFISPQTVLKTYELGGPKTYTLAEIVDLLQKIKHRRRLKIHLPMSLMRLLALAMETVLPHPPLTRDVLLMLEEDNVVTDASALRDFEFTPASMEDALLQYLV